MLKTSIIFLSTASLKGCLSLILKRKSMITSLRSLDLLPKWNSGASDFPRSFNVSITKEIIGKIKELDLMFN